MLPSVMLQHDHEKLVGKFPVAGVADQFFHVRLLRGHKLEERAVDLCKRCVRRNLIDSSKVILRKLREQVLIQRSNAGVVKIEGLAVDHGAFRQLLDGDVGSFSFQDHFLEHAFDGVSCFQYFRSIKSFLKISSFQNVWRKRHDFISGN